MNTQEKQMLVDRLAKNGERFATLIHLNAPRELLAAELENIRRITFELERMIEEEA